MRTTGRRCSAAAQGIMVDPDSGAFMAGADPRRDGYAMAW